MKFNMAELTDKKYNKILHGQEKLIKKLEAQLHRMNSMSGRSGSSKTALFVSDMHVGSSLALAPRHPYNSENDVEIKPNRVMSKLTDIWEYCIDHISQKPNVLGMVGEPMDGDNFKQVGQQSWSTSYIDQVNASSELLKMWKAPNIIMVRGSGYHVQRGATNFEELVARNIGAKRYRAYLPEDTTGVNERDTASITDYFADFRINNKVFNMSHHIGYSKNEMYRTTGMARELVTMRLSTGLYNKADVVVRGHVHYFVRVSFTHTSGFTCPAWKLPDAHLFRGGVGGTKPDIGVVECIVEPNESVLIRPIIVETDLKPLIKDF